jgi:signal transduction histidine kinase
MRGPPWSTLRAKVLGTVLLAVACQLAALAFDAVQFQQIGLWIGTINDAWLPLAREASRMEAQVARGDQVRLVESATKASGLAQAAAKNPPDDEERAHLQAAVAQCADVLAAAAQGGEAARDEVLQLAALADSRIAAVSRKTESAQAAAQRTSVLLALLTPLLGGVLWWYAAGALRPITGLTEGVRQLARGERPAFRVEGDEEIATLARAMQLAVEAIEERDRASEKLARSERLALVGQMLAQVTHEVRNPLNAMSLHAELLGEDVADPEQRKLVDTIVAEIRRLESVTERYLDLARRRPPEAAVEDPVALAEAVVGLEEEKLRRAGVEVAVVGVRGASREFDGNAIRRSLLNLVRNAAEAGAKRVRVEVSVTESYVSWSVVDDGPGMAPDVAARVFDPFFSTRARGTGLGLAIARQDVEDLGGTLSVESTLGVGSTFRVVLPAPVGGRGA